MERLINTERKHELFQAILELKTLEECEAFFEDLCAMNELKTMEQRFEVAQMLVDNKVYSEITEKTNASSATISRVKRVLQLGNGTLLKVLDSNSQK